jgi:hypothetical protein
MFHRNFSLEVVTGSVVMERFAQVSVPPMLRPHVRAFGAAHGALQGTVKRASDARAARKVGIDAVEAADRALRGGLLALAGSIVAAGRGTLRRPFAEFGGEALSGYAKGSRVRAVKQAELVLAAIATSTVPDAVRKAAANCAKQCTGVTTAYAKLGGLRVEFRQSRGARDAALAAYVAAFGDVKNIAKVAWRDDAGTFDVVFGTVERDRFGRKTRKKDTTPTPGSTVTKPSDPAATSPGPTVTPPATVTTPAASPPTASPAPKANGASTALVS